MLRKLSSLSEQNCTNLAEYILVRTIKAMKNTSKADKFTRLFANITKLLRTITPESKQKYSKFYKQLLILRQVFRWQGMYEAIIQFKEKGWKMFQLKNINNLAWILFEMFGDTLDRIMFVIQTFGLEKYEGLLGKLDQMESDCYFIQCTIWLVYHLRTANKVNKEGDRKKIKVKILKIIKYLLDTITSHNKFSKRVIELGPGKIAIIGIVSSLIGIYDIMT